MLSVFSVSLSVEINVGLWYSERVITSQLRFPDQQVPMDSSLCTALRRPDLSVAMTTNFALRDCLILVFDALKSFSSTSCSDPAAEKRLVASTPSNWKFPWESEVVEKSAFVPHMSLDRMIALQSASREVSGRSSMSFLSPEISKVRFAMLNGVLPTKRCTRVFGSVTPLM